MISALALCAALAQDVSWVETRFHRVHLRNGNFIDGRLVRESPALIVLEVKPAGEFGVRRDMIQRVEFVKMRSIREEPPIVARIAAPVEPTPPAVVPGPAPERAEASPAKFSAEVRGSVDSLLGAYASANPDHRGSLGASLRNLGPRAVAYACWVARVGRTAVKRAELVEAIGLCDTPEVLPALLEFATLAPDQDVRVAAIRALAKREEPEAAAAVQDALSDRAAKVGQAAAEEVAALYAKGRLALAVLIDRMNGSSRKEFPALALGKTGENAALDALQRLMREGEPKDKIAGLKALTGHARPADIDLAIDLLDHPDAELRAEVCYSLGRGKQGRAVRPLISSLSDEDEHVVEGALWALRRVTGQSFPKDPEVWLAWWDRTGKDSFPEGRKLEE